MFHFESVRSYDYNYFYWPFRFEFFFHLLTHALFKALLFICAGDVIHSIGDSQDICFRCGLYIYIPFTSSSLMVSNFALCGIPFLAGFYSRDFSLEIFSMRYVNMFL